MPQPDALLPRFTCGAVEPVPAWEGVAAGRYRAEVTVTAVTPQRGCNSAASAGCDCGQKMAIEKQNLMAVGGCRRVSVDGQMWVDVGGCGVTAGWIDR